MTELTKAEEQIMHLLWDMKKAFVKDLLEVLDEPKPAYNTVSTIIRTLEKKGFVGHKSYGNSHQYYPLVDKEEYTKHFMKRVVSNYFGNSVKQLVSFFSREEDLSLKEVDEIIKTMQELKKNTHGK
ncbi:MAG: BlaI/MecI/CopY family transcriptional regulator [Bacteroidetes bacterium]|nr:BlaI/MecI/CopY family transcriptional regulator [Bacteroidota bacterium]